MTTYTDQELLIRGLEPDEGDELERLAQRDGSRVPEGTVLAAVAPSGTLLAAISLESGELVADPFLPSGDAASLLRMRARQQVGRTSPPARRHRFRRSRAALPASPPGAGGRLLQLADFARRAGGA